MLMEGVTRLSFHRQNMFFVTQKTQNRQVNLVFRIQKIELQNFNMKIVDKYRLLRLWHTSPRGAYARPTLQYELKTSDGRTVDSVTGQWLWSKSRIELRLLKTMLSLLSSLIEQFGHLKKIVFKMEGLKNLQVFLIKRLQMTQQRISMHFYQRLARHFTQNLPNLLST